MSVNSTVSNAGHALLGAEQLGKMTAAFDTAASCNLVDVKVRV